MLFPFWHTGLTKKDVRILSVFRYLDKELWLVGAISALKGGSSLCDYVIIYLTNNAAKSILPHRVQFLSAFFESALNPDTVFLVVVHAHYVR